MKFRMQCKDGSYVWMLSQGALAERDREGRPVRVVGTLKNINKRVNVLLQLEQSEAKLRAITENSRNIMVLKDMQGRYLHVNRRFEEAFGFSRNNVLGKTDLEVFPPDMARQYRENDRWTLSTGETYEVEEQAPSMDGTVYTYATIKIPICDERGQIHAICGMATDITERKCMEDELRVAAVAFETPIGMMVTDANQVIQRVNQAFIDSTGFTADQVVGKTPRCLQSGKHNAAFYRAMWRSIHETGNWQGEIWGRRRDKVLYLKWLTISTVRDAAGRVSHYVGAESDISGRKQAEAALQALNRSLRKQKEQLRELVAKNEATRESERKHIAREVHDELGQALSALRMDTSFIAMRFGALDPALEAKVLGMRTLVDHAIQGVRNVASNLRPIALDMGLALALDWLCQDFTKHSGIDCVLDCGDMHVELDEARAIMVFRIVQESLTNISRYAGASLVRVNLGQSGGALGLEVQDNGQGFDPQLAQQRKTFGLLGMRERALALGGRLDIVSAPGLGATIALSIPYQPPMGPDLGAA
jgi:PAS domain S-box-containing protein